VYQGSLQVNGVNSISLSGYLVRHTDSHELGVISTLFTNYLNGDESPVIVIGQSTLQSDGSSISWLSSALQALRLIVPFKSLDAINPINSITIGELELDFNAQNPWSPIAQSNSVTASMSKEPWIFHQSPMGLNSMLHRVTFWLQHQRW